MESVPFEESAASVYATPEQWSVDAPDTVRRMLERWELHSPVAFVGGISGAVFRVVQADGTPAVLKVAFPHVEGRFEAVGLQAFPPGCAPSVLRQDPWTWSMLLSAVTPGTPLRDREGTAAEAMEIGGRLYARLTGGVPSDALPRLSDAMRDYAEQGRARLGSQTEALDALGVRDLVEHSLDELEELAASGPTHSLLHGDFNPGNILEAAPGSPGSPGGLRPDEPDTGNWVVVDPKPLVGDPAYDLWPLIAQIGNPFAAPDPVARLRDNLLVACGAAELDPARVARWGAARTGLNVSWYLAAGDAESAASDARSLRTWRSVAQG
jgi:streptomycin 6-kinase